MNIKYYLVSGEGGSQIDASRVEARTSGTVKEKGREDLLRTRGRYFQRGIPEEGFWEYLISREFHQSKAESLRRA